MKHQALLAALLILFAHTPPHSDARAQSPEWRPLGPVVERTDVQTFTAPTWPSDQVLFAASKHSLTRSDDDGATWTRLPHYFGERMLIVPTPGVDSSGLVFAVDAGSGSLAPSGLLRSTDRGESWSVAAEVPYPSFQITDDVFIFAPDFQASGIAYYLDSGLLHRTRDFGATWDWIDISAVARVPAEVAPIGQRIRQVVLSPDFARDRTLFASAAIGRAFPAPEDVEADRRRQAEGLPRSLTDNHLTSLGIIVSRDAGNTWTGASTGLALDGQPARFVASLAISPTFERDRTLFAWAWGAPERAQIEQEARLRFANGLFRSDDGGGSWVLVWDRPTHPTDVDIASSGTVQLLPSPSYSTDRTVLAAISRPRQVRETTRLPDARKPDLYPRCDVHRSTDGGSHWQVTVASPDARYYQPCGRMRDTWDGHGWRLVIAGFGFGGGSAWQESRDGGSTWSSVPMPQQQAVGEGMTLSRLGPGGAVLMTSRAGAWTLGGPAPAQPGTPTCPIRFAVGLEPLEQPFSSTDQFGCAAEAPRMVTVQERRLYGRIGLWFDDESTEWLLLTGGKWGQVSDPRPDSRESGDWRWRSKADDPWTGPPDRVHTGLMQRAWGGTTILLTAGDGSRWLVRIMNPTPSNPTEHYWWGIDPDTVRP